MALLFCYCFCNSLDSPCLPNACVLMIMHQLNALFSCFDVQNLPMYVSAWFFTFSSCHALFLFMFSSFPNAKPKSPGSIPSNVLFVSAFEECCDGNCCIWSVWISSLPKIDWCLGISCCPLLWWFLHTWDFLFPVAPRGGNWRISVCMLCWLTFLLPNIPVVQYFFIVLFNSFASVNRNFG